MLESSIEKSAIPFEKCPGEQIQTLKIEFC